MRQQVVVPDGVSDGLWKGECGRDTRGLCGTTKRYQFIITLCGTTKRYQFVITLCGTTKRYQFVITLCATTKKYPYQFVITLCGTTKKRYCTVHTLQLLYTNF